LSSGRITCVKRPIHPEHAQYAKLGGLGLMLLAMALLMWPGLTVDIVMNQD
jgi:hypothetical protein